MNKNLLLIIGLAIVGAVGAFLFLKNPSKPAMEKLASSGVSPKTFAELMALGEDYTCTFQDTDDAGNTTSGTVYIAERGERMSGSFEVELANESTMQSNIIRDGDYNYVWQEGTEEGYKMKVDPEDESFFPEREETDEQEMIFDENEEVDFECERWKVDSSMFVPPSDVEFIDLSAQMELMQEQMEQANEQIQDQIDQQIDCSVCDQVPAGQGRDQCLATLGC